MAKTKNPRSASPRNKKNGAEAVASPSATPAVDTATPQSPVLKAPAATPDLSAVDTGSLRTKADTGPIEVKSDTTRKPIIEPRRTIVPINLEEEIRRRAYQLYEERGCTPGHANDDWLVAEREVLMRYSAQQHSA